MFDGVINHISSQSDWFKGFLRNDPHYRDCHITVEGSPDLTQVVRPRALPLLTLFPAVTCYLIERDQLTAISFLAIMKSRTKGKIMLVTEGITVAVTLSRDGASATTISQYTDAGLLKHSSYP